MRLLRLPKEAFRAGETKAIEPGSLTPDLWRELWLRVDNFYMAATGRCFLEGARSGQFSHGTFHFSEVSCRAKNFHNRKTCCVQFDRRSGTAIVNWHKPYDPKAPCRNQEVRGVEG